MGSKFEPPIGGQKGIMGEGRKNINKKEVKVTQKEKKKKNRQKL